MSISVANGDRKGVLREAHPPAEQTRQSLEQNEGKEERLHRHRRRGLTPTMGGPRVPPPKPWGSLNSASVYAMREPLGFFFLLTKHMPYITLYAQP